MKNLIFVSTIFFFNFMPDKLLKIWEWAKNAVKVTTSLLTSGARCAVFVGSRSQKFLASSRVRMPTPGVNWLNHQRKIRFKTKIWNKVRNSYLRGKATVRLRVKIRFCLIEFAFNILFVIYKLSYILPCSWNNLMNSHKYAAVTLLTQRKNAKSHLDKAVWIFNNTKRSIRQPHSAVTITDPSFLLNPWNSTKCKMKNYIVIIFLFYYTLSEKKIYN